MKFELKFGTIILCNNVFSFPHPIFNSHFQNTFPSCHLLVFSFIFLFYIRNCVKARNILYMHNLCFLFKSILPPDILFYILYSIITLFNFEINIFNCLAVEINKLLIRQVIYFSYILKYFCNFLCWYFHEKLEIHAYFLKSSNIYYTLFL